MGNAVLVSVALLGAGTFFCDDAWTIRPHQLQAQSFALKKASTVKIYLNGVKHAEKGFAVHIVPTALWENFRAGHATFKAIQDASTEHAGVVERTTEFKAGNWTLLVENDQNALEPITVRARISIEDPAAKEGSAGPRTMKVGECVVTTVKEVGFRLGEARSGTQISYTNGLGQVSYEQDANADASRPGDQIKLCLVSVPTGCPPGDDERGKVYKATNQRTGKSWSMSNSQHSCGGA